MINLKDIILKIQCVSNKLELNAIIFDINKNIKNDDFSSFLKLIFNDVDKLDSLKNKDEKIAFLKNNNNFLDLLTLFLTLKNKIVNLILLKHDIVDREYLILFALFYPLNLFILKFNENANCTQNLHLKNTSAIEMANDKIQDFINIFCQDDDNQCNEILQSYEFLAANNFLKLNNDEMIMIIELGAFAKMLQLKIIESIEFYIFGILHVDFDSILAKNVKTFLLENLDSLNIDFYYIQNAIKKALAQDYFFSLNGKMQRSIFNWQLHIIWNVKRYFNTKSWLEMYEIYKNIFYKYIEKNDTKNVLYVQFFIYHICGNSYENLNQWKKFNDEISQEAVALYQKYQKENLYKSNNEINENKNKDDLNANGNAINTKHNTKKIINIAILKDRLVLNSPYKVEYSLLKNCKSHKYQINFRIYLMNFIEKSKNDTELIEELNKININVIDVVSQFHNESAKYYNSHLDKALALYHAIKNDKNDILISPNNGYGISDFLMCSDCCKHRVFYSHGNFVYDIAGITARLTHICDNKNLIAHNGFLFHGISVKMDDSFYTPYIDQNLIKNLKESYKIDENTMIFGIIGRLIKINSENYLKCIIEIMKSTNSVFLCCGVGNEKSLKDLILKLSNEKMLERFKFLGFVNSAIYGYIIDFWPDTFPMQQGESRIEFSHKNGLNLTLSIECKDTRKKRITDLIEQNHFLFNENKDELLHILLDDSFIAFTESEYVPKFMNLIVHKNAKKELLMAQNKIIDTIRSYRSSVMFDEFLDSILK